MSSPKGQYISQGPGPIAASSVYASQPLPAQHTYLPAQQVYNAQLASHSLSTDTLCHNKLASYVHIKRESVTWPVSCPTGCSHCLSQPDIELKAPSNHLKLLCAYDGHCNVFCLLYLVSLGQSGKMAVSRSTLLIAASLSHAICPRHSRLKSTLGMGALPLLLCRHTRGTVLSLRQPVL